MFERRAERNTTLVLLVSVVLTFASSACFFIPPGGILLSQSRVRKCLLSAIITIVSSLLCELYLDKARDAVYDEVKKYSDQVQQATADKEVFFATMSHEIRNPLQTLLGSVELLQQRYKDGVGQGLEAKLNGIVKSCCEMVLNLVTNILDVAKIDAEKLEIAPIAGNLGENIGKIVRVSAGRALAKGLKLSYVEPRPLPPCLSFDPQRLSQVLLNLISNAIKFTQKGQIIVTATWVPLHDDGVDEKEASNVLQRELKVSSWTRFFDPLQEFDDPESQSRKMLKISAPRTFMPKVGRSKIGIRAESQHRNSDDRHDSAGLTENDILADAEHPLGRPKVSSKVSERYIRGGSADMTEKSQLPAFGPDISHNFPLYEVTQGFVRVEVMDTGIGISKQGVPKLFQRYQQADSTISRYCYTWESAIGTTEERDSDCGSRTP